LRPDSLSGVTNVNGPAADEGLPPPWLIVIGIVGALALVFLLGAGVGQEWGAEQWGPVAAWLAGAATLAAVVVALRQAGIAQRQAMQTRHESMDLQVARLVDHEVSRRRECIKAVSDLWAALVGMTIEFRSFTDYLDNLPSNFDGRLPRLRDVPPERMGESYANELGRRFQTFFDRWVGVIQPPLFVALAILHDTKMYDALNGINDGIADMSKEDTEGGFVGIRKAIFADALQGVGRQIHSRLPPCGTTSSVGVTSISG
jgi:hypothetical protein